MFMRVCSVTLSTVFSAATEVEPRSHSILFAKMVPENGVEPSRPCGHRILSPARLPVPPLGHCKRITQVLWAKEFEGCSDERPFFLKGVSRHSTDRTVIALSQGSCRNETQRGRA